jgi:hypothetical protein
VLTLKGIIAITDEGFQLLAPILPNLERLDIRECPKVRLEYLKVVMLNIVQIDYRCIGSDDFDAGQTFDHVEVTTDNY